ncbi:MAG: acetyl-CoA carboxylase biotin carboxyl carrier protein [Schleiferiaceae bacterium]|nr:acetyl-CoA carboxylase biotin carboxyl carrier protein [Schleiferiaceae bacterium]
MDFKEVQNFIKFVTKSGASEVSLETEDYKITVKSGSEQTAVYTAPPVASQIPISPSQEKVVNEEKETEDEFAHCSTITSPMIGTFYRKPSPDKPSFAEIGSHINVGDTICIIEAMKLFNEIESEVSGKIVKVLADDMTPVEFGQPLFLVDPS